MTPDLTRDLDALRQHFLSEHSRRIEAIQRLDAEHGARTADLVAYLHSVGEAIEARHEHAIDALRRLATALNLTPPEPPQALTSGPPPLPPEFIQSARIAKVARALEQLGGTHGR